MIASNPHHPSGGDDRDGRTKQHQHRPIGSNLICGTTVITSDNGFLHGISPAILLTIVLFACATPLANGAEPDYFRNLFDGATYRGWDCYALLSLSNDIDTCYTKAKSDNCADMKTFWSCVHHKSCGRCDLTGALELLQTMQANVRKTNCSGDDVVLPAGGCLEKANTGKCFDQLEKADSITKCKTPQHSKVHNGTSTQKPKAEKCEEERAESNCLMKEACEHCDYSAASAMAIEQESLLYEDGYCTQPNDSSSNARLHSCSYFNVSRNATANETEQDSTLKLHEDFMKCFETLKNDSEFKKCLDDGNANNNITDNSTASLIASCGAVDFSLHCINELSCKKCTYLGSWAVYYWYNKAIQREGCEDLDRKEFKKECQTNLTSPPTFGPTEKETTETPERKSTTQASSSKTGLIIGMIVLVLILIVCGVGGYFYWAGLSETDSDKKKGGDSSGTGGKGGGPAPKSTLGKAAEGKSKVGSSVAGSQAPKSSLAATKSKVGQVGSGVAGTTKAPSAVKSKLGSAASGTGAGKVPSSVIKSKIGPTASGTAKATASGVKSSVSSGIKVTGGSKSNVGSGVGPTASKAKQTSKSTVAAVASKSKA